MYHLSEPTVLQSRTLLNLMKLKEEEEVRGGGGGGGGGVE
jgi:hypothetical protein